jgi:hypothetical protein
MSYQARSQQLLTSILAAEYYLSILTRIIGPLDAAPAKLESMADGQLNSMWNDFWWKLPDSPVIRTGPFYVLCDLCEEEMHHEQLEIEISEDDAPAF